jgi:hypothetical protein
VNTKEIERAAYVAAHRVLAADTSAHELACPGARKSRAIDTIAGIIRETFELHNVAYGDSTKWLEATPESRPHLVDRRRTGVLRDLPLRASS